MDDHDNDDDDDFDDNDRKCQIMMPIYLFFLFDNLKIYITNLVLYCLKSRAI